MGGASGGVRLFGQECTGDDGGGQRWGTRIEEWERKEGYMIGGPTLRLRGLTKALC